MTISSLDKVLTELWGNWAFRLSLSSNELFHSNVLQYLAEGTQAPPSVGEADLTDDGGPSPVGEHDDKDSQPAVISVEAARRLLDVLCVGERDRATAAYDKLDVLAPDTALAVHREWRRMDLVVLVPEAGPRKGQTLRPLFALEVKVKDYPEANQLERYREVLDDWWSTPDKKTKQKTYRPPLFLLTGMGEEVVAGDQPGGATSSLNFGDLAKGLEASRVIEDPIGKEYIALCWGLDALFQELRRQRSDALSWKAASQMGARLRPYRLHSLWWKLWAAYVGQQCNSLIQNALDEKKIRSDHLHVYSGFTKTGRLGIYWNWAEPPRPAKPHEAINLGIQIEGRSVRLSLEVLSSGLGEGGKASEARLEVEAALLRLLRTHGVFARNPMMNTLKMRWEKPLKVGDGSYRNLDIWRNLGHACMSSPEPMPDELFEDRAGKGHRINDDVPMLPGYANAPGNGFADIRLTLKENATVGKVAEMVRDVLVGDVFSAPGVADSTPLLLRVVQGFGVEKDKAAWLKKPTLAGA